MTRLVTHATWRFPKARPAHTSDHGWLVILDGPAQNVIPRGVHEIDVNDHPLHLDTTVDDAYLSLDQASQVDDDLAGAVGTLSTSPNVER